MITTSEARRIAGEWHGGQASALYAFASSGSITPNLISEIKFEIAQAVAPGEAIRELLALLEYVNRIKCQWPDCENHGTELASTVFGVKRYCDYHLSEWEDAQSAEYISVCPNCGCPYAHQLRKLRR